MSGLEAFDDRVWDRFFDFTAPDVERMSASEIDAELRRAGIDVSPVLARVRQAIEATKARKELECARARRGTVTQRLAELTFRPIEGARELLQRMIEGSVPAIQRPVYFRKLEQAATDGDIRSLLEDIQRLESFNPGDGDGQR